MKNVEDIYPASPMQAMMLLHALPKVSKAQQGRPHRQQHSPQPTPEAAPDPRGDVLFNQFCYQINGSIDTLAFQQAWQHLVNRHSVLRTAFVWDKMDQPLQIVRQQCELPFAHLDWQNLSAEQQHQQFRHFCQQDRQQGFSLNKAPLMRLTLILLSQQKYYLVWSSHHLLLDRWCLPTLLSQLHNDYQQLTQDNSQGDNLPSPSENNAPTHTGPRFRDYIHWIQQQDRQQGLAFWRDHLNSFLQPSLLIPPQQSDSNGDEQVPHAHQTLSPGIYLALLQYGHRHKLTLGTLIQGAWALVLNHYCQLTDICFGTTAAGRPADLCGVENMVGSFINNLPVRIRLSPELSLHQWLGNIQRHSQQRQPYEYLSPADINECSQVGSSLPLFDHLLLIQGEQKQLVNASFDMKPLHFQRDSAYPLTISAEDNGQQLDLYIQIAPGAHAPPLDQLLTLFHSQLESLSLAGPGTLLNQLMSTPPTAPETAVQAQTQHHQSIPGTRPVTRPGMRPAYTITGQQPSGSIKASALVAKGRESMPLDVIREVLTALWQQILQIPGIDADEDFFELGGNSIQASRLHLDIENHFRLTLPLLTLFQQPTINQMASQLHQNAWPLTSQLAIAIQPGGRRPPLFCIASPEVLTLGYSLLARELDPQQPLFVLQAPPDSDRVRQLKAGELPQLAREYIQAMQQIQPRGPYQLLGMCTGSQLAIEMGRQLSQQQQSPEFLGIINTWAFNTVSRKYHIEKCFNLYRYYRDRIGRLYSSPVIQTATQSPTPSESATAPETDSGQPYSLIDDVGWARLPIHTATYPGTVTVFRLNNQPYWRITSQDLGWQRHARQVKVYRLSGNSHLDILRPPAITEFARGLQTCLSTSNNKTHNMRDTPSAPQTSSQSPVNTAVPAHDHVTGEPQ